MTDMEKRVAAVAQWLAVTTQRKTLSTTETLESLTADFRPRAENLLRLAFPELFTDPPTAWLAPVEPTESMQNAVHVANLVPIHGLERMAAARDIWRHMMRRAMWDSGRHHNAHLPGAPVPHLSNTPKAGEKND